jgi:thiol:disulfide interchange protein DsbD
MASTYKTTQTTAIHSTIPLIIVSLLLACFSSISFAQASTTQWGESLFTTPSLDSTIINLDSTAITFLPVEQAYQLSATQINEDTLQINWEIAPGYYLYKHQIKAHRLNNAEPITLELPAGEIKYDEVFEKDLEVYYQRLRYQVNANQTTVLLSQGCADAGLCYPPQTHHITLDPYSGVTTITNTDQLNTQPLSNQGSSSQNSLISRSGSTTNSNSTNNPDSTSKPDMDPLLILSSMFAALIGGIFLNLMPCVFPVLSLKALSLMQAHHGSHKQHIHGWMYTAGCISTFCLVALVMITLRNSGQLIGWGFQLQSPIFVALLAYLFFTMSLLLLSSRTLIGSQITNLGQSLTQGHSYKASFFTGSLATVVASPCTAPFMGAALGYAITLPTFAGLCIFAALGFGMALPFLILSYSPKLAEMMPSPGQWMENLKQFLAFPLLLTAVWLLWVLGRQTNSDIIIGIICGAVFIAMGAWFYNIKKSIAIIFFLLALLPLTNISSDKSFQTNSPLENGWEVYTEQRLQQLLQSNTPIFVNLTADWCITCLANEKVALNTDASKAAFNAAGVVKLKGDWTNYNPEITQLLNRFGRNGVPLYIFYPRATDSKFPAPQVLPQILSQETIINTIKP